MARLSYPDRVASTLEDVWYFSVGSCEGCPDCPEGEPEGEFSHRACESCGEHLAGDRHPAHGYLGDDSAAALESNLEHFQVCTDCVMYHANGDLPEGEGAYQLELTDRDLATLRWVGGRYGWSSALLDLVDEPGTWELDEPEAWELREAVEGDDAWCPCLDPASDLAAKLAALLESIV